VSFSFVLAKEHCGPLHKAVDLPVASKCAERGR